MSTHPHTPLPMPARGRAAYVVVAALCSGVALLAYALLAGPGARSDVITHFPSPRIAAPANVPPQVAVQTPPAAVARPSVAQQRAQTQTIDALKGPTHITAAWEGRFYPIYAAAAKAFAVNPLLIASIHKQESAFSTASTTYHGVNFAGCCAGPMQFNVTNGPVTTWARFKTAFQYGARPASYDHMTNAHPSVYDDFDSIMAGAWLLRASGAGAALDGTAWQAAYDYYGHDATGVAYADEVLARARGWARDGFCVNCGVDPALVAQADAQYGTAARGALAPATPPRYTAKHHAHH